MKIVAFGDSITYGDTGDHQEPHPRRWTTLLAEKTGHEVVNRGVNGDTTRLALERFPADVQESGADVVLIQFGYNDCNHWDTDRGAPRVSLDAYKANLIEMRDRAERFNVHPVFLGMFQPRRGPAFHSWWLPYNWAFNEVSKYSMFPSFMRLEIPDGLHFSDDDHESYAEYLSTRFP